MPRPRHDASDPRLPIGTNYCKCSACGEVFGGSSGFEFHRVGEFEGDRRCRTKKELRKAGYAADDMGRWRLAVTGTRRDALTAARPGAERP